MMRRRLKTEHLFGELIYIFSLKSVTEDSRKKKS